MPWRVVEGRIGRAGGVDRRTARQREWDGKYGEGNWEVGYVIDGEFVAQSEARESAYSRSHEEPFAAHPEDVEELIRTAGRLLDPTARSSRAPSSTSSMCAPR